MNPSSNYLNFQSNSPREIEASSPTKEVLKFAAEKSSPRKTLNPLSPRNPLELLPDTQLLLNHFKNSLEQDSDVKENGSVLGNFDIPELLSELQVDHDDNFLFDEATGMLFRKDYKTFGNFLDGLNKATAARVVFKLLEANVKVAHLYNGLIEFLITKYKLSGLLLIHSPTERVITLEGLKILADHLKEKGSLKLPCIFCDTYQDFEAELGKLMEDNSENFKIQVFVRNAGGPEGLGLADTPHITPVYIEKKEGVLHAVMIDSLGETGMYSYFVGESITKCTGVIPYDYEYQRQFDKTNCAVVALRDAVKISQEPDFINFVMTHPSETVIDGVVIFNRLPASMMKVTQSLSKIKEYNDSDLSKSLEKHHGSFVDKDGTLHMINTLAATRFKKYERIIVAKVIELGIEKKQGL